MGRAVVGHGLHLLASRGSIATGHHRAHADAMLQELVRAKHDEIVSRTRTRVALRHAPRATVQEMEFGVPLFLHQLVEFLGRASTDVSAPNGIDASATVHGAELLRMGLTIAQVVHGYGDVCQAVTELAHEQHIAVSAQEFRLLNLALDDAIAAAVTEYMRLHDESISQHNLEQTGVLAHEMRNCVNNAVLAFELMKDGQVGPNGSTGGILKRSLETMQRLVDRSLVEVRLQAQLYQPFPVRVAELVEELEVTAAVQARARGLRLSVSTVPYDIEISVDRPLLASALSNLLQNAVKFTRANGAVVMNVSASEAQVLIEVEDECGGLPPGQAEELFRPFEQRSTDRSGIGLGLAIAKRAVEAQGGLLGVRNLPGKGCVFSVELPRLQR